MDGRADAGGDATADERGAIQGHVFADLHQRVFMHQHLLRERTQVGELAQAAVVVMQARRLAFATPHFGFLAQRHAPREAVFAMPAKRRQAGDDVIARLHIGDGITHRLDDASGFVAEHHRQLAGVGAVVEVHVRMADARRRRAHQHLARLRLVHRHLFDRHGRVDLSQHRCLHPCLLPPIPASVPASVPTPRGDFQRMGFTVRIARHGRP